MLAKKERCIAKLDRYWWLRKRDVLISYRDIGSKARRWVLSKRDGLLGVEWLSSELVVHLAAAFWIPIIDIL